MIKTQKTLDIHDAPQLVCDWFCATYADIGQDTYRRVDVLPKLDPEDDDGMPELVYKWFISQGIREPEWHIDQDGIVEFTLHPETVLILYWW